VKEELDKTGLRCTWPTQTTGIQVQYTTDYIKTGLFGEYRKRSLICNSVKKLVWRNEECAVHVWKRRGDGIHGLEQ
jgi:hypothetical protein